MEGYLLLGGEVNPETIMDFSGTGDRHEELGYCLVVTQLANDICHNYFLYRLNLIIIL